MKTQMIKSLLCIAPIAAFASDGDVESPHSIAPSFQYMEFKNELFTTSTSLFGVEYKYSQPRGYNARIIATISEGGKFRPNASLDMKHTYKLDFLDEYKIYPVVGMNASVMCFYTGSQKNPEISQYSLDYGIEKAEITLGIGFEGKLNHRFTFNPEFEFFKEVAKYRLTRQKVDSAYFGWEMPKNSGFKISMPINIMLTASNFLEVTPFYSYTFKDGYYTRGVKASYAFAF